MKTILMTATLLCLAGAGWAQGQGNDKKGRQDAGEDIDVLLNQVEAFSVRRGTEPRKNAENFQVAMKRLSERKNSEKARLIRESKRVDKGWAYRCAIMRVISPVQEDLVAETLIENLRDKNPKIRECAARQLGEQKGSRAVEPLMKSLADIDPLVRSHSARSLGQMKSKRAIDYLKTSSKDRDDIAAINAIWALGEIGDVVASDFLIGLMKDVDETKKVNIVIALAKLKSDKALEHLRKISTSDSEPSAVRGLALEIVQKLDKGLKPW